MNQCFRDVLAFHQKFGAVVGSTPAVPDADTVMLRRMLLSEEFNELIDAIHRDDLAEIADGIADLIYVATGTAISYGIDLREVWDAVQRSNMAKSQKKRADGKTEKPENWVAPDVAGILARQAPIAGRKEYQ